jgi:hypothetical protein
MIDNYICKPRVKKMKYTSLKLYLGVLNKYLNFVGIKEKKSVKTAMKYIEMMKGLNFSYNTIQTTVKILQCLLKFQPRLKCPNLCFFIYSAERRESRKILMLNFKSVKSWLFENCTSRHVTTFQLALLINVTISTDLKLKDVLEKSVQDIHTILTKNISKIIWIDLVDLELTKSLMNECYIDYNPMNWDVRNLF